MNQEDIATHKSQEHQGVGSSELVNRLRLEMTSTQCCLLAHFMLSIFCIVSGSTTKSKLQLKNSSKITEMNVETLMVWKTPNYRKLKRKINSSKIKIVWEKKKDKLRRKQL